MKKTILIAALIIVGLVALIAAAGFYRFNFTNGGDKVNVGTMSEEQARAIAQSSCIKGGEALSSGYYNENSKTWWFDANLNATQEGCNPACVVSEQTKTAEINWRCTGAKPPQDGGGKMCAQVITRAKNSKTGEIMDFPTPCDVPSDWVIIKNDTACTQEAKLCSDGSYVSRTGPGCEFAPCPTSTTCTCPSGYHQEGDACNPECYYSTPACLMPSLKCQ